MFCHSPGGRRATSRGPRLADTEWLHSEGRYEGILNTIFWGVSRDRMKAVSLRPFVMNPSGGMNLTTQERGDRSS